MEHHDLNAEEAGQPTPPEIDEMKMQMFMQNVRDNQNLLFGILAGAGVALAGGLLWALVTALSGWQIGFMAVGIGFVVGHAIRKFGQGVDMSFGIAGAVLSLLGCVLGNLLAVSISIAGQESMGIIEVLGLIDLSIAIDLIVETFSPMDILFYGLAIYYGYKYAFRVISEQELATLVKG